MNKEDIKKTVEILDDTYPNGWRTGNPFNDSMMVVISNGLRKMCDGLFSIEAR